MRRICGGDGRGDRRTCRMRFTNILAIFLPHIVVRLVVKPAFWLANRFPVYHLSTLVLNLVSTDNLPSFVVVAFQMDFSCVFCRALTFTLTMRSGDSVRRKASRLSTGTWRTET